MEERTYDILDENGEVVRQVSEEELSNYYYCQDCNNYYIEDAVEEIVNWDGSYSGNFVCKKCLENTDYYWHCEYCGSLHYSDDMTYVEDMGYACNSCEDRYSYCEDCGRYYDNDDIAHYDEDTGYYYCCNCYHDRADKEDYVYEYHEFKDWQFFKNDDEEPPYYIGFENEIEPAGSPKHSEVVPLIKNSINAVCMHDGSLDYGGIEIVSHPQSFNYIMTHKQDYINLFNKLTNDYDYRSHNTQNCGLHFHVTRPANDEVTNRIWHILESYKDELVRFSRRNYDQIEHWAQFLSDNGNSSIKLKSLKYIDEHKAKNNRYFALNLTNNGTIEFRFIRGTLKPETFLASVELINNIMTLCSDLSIPINEITWDKLTNTEYAKRYCEDMGIFTNKKPIDLTERLESYLKEQKELVEKAQKMIKSFSNKRLKDLNEKIVTNAEYMKSSSLWTLRDKLYSWVGDVGNEAETIESLNRIASSAESLSNSMYELEHYYSTLNKYYRTRLINISKKLKKLDDDLIKENN